jgi:hypothetical protein
MFVFEHAKVPVDTKNIFEKLPSDQNQCLPSRSETFLFSKPGSRHNSIRIRHLASFNQNRLESLISTGR